MCDSKALLYIFLLVILVMINKVYHVQFGSVHLNALSNCMSEKVNKQKEAMS